MGARISPAHASKQWNAKTTLALCTDLGLTFKENTLEILCGGIFILQPLLKSTLMNHIHYCVWKGGVGTKQGLFYGLLLSCGAGSPIPWNSEVKIRVRGNPMGGNKNRNTGMYRNTLSLLRGSISHCFPHPLPHQCFR